MKFTVSGKAMELMAASELMLNPQLYDADDPAVERASKALHTAPRRRTGKGWSYLLDCDPGAAEVIRDYCATVGQMLSSGAADPDARPDGRALLQIADRITAQTGEKV